MIKQKFTKTIATGIIAIGLFIGGGNAEAATYNDVPTTHNEHNSIHYLTDRNIISGYTDGTFKPNADVTRAQASRIIWGGVENLNIQFPASQKREMPKFRDVRATDWHNPFVTKMYENQIINGYPDNSFRPNETVTHSQLVKMVADAFQLKTGSNKLPFTDVTTNNWYEPAVNAVYTAGIIQSNGSKFEPNRNMSRADVSAYVAKAMQVIAPPLVDETPIVDDVVIIDETPVVGEQVKDDIKNPISNDEQKKYPKSYKMMTEGFEQLSKNIYYDTAEMNHLSFDDFNNTINKMTRKDPNRYFISGWSTYKREGRINVRYIAPTEELQQMQKENNAAADAIIQKIIKPGQTDYEKVKAIHDYIVLNTAYNIEGYNNNNIDDLSYLSYGVLNRGVAVCDGYTRAFNQLMESVGIESHYVFGYVNGNGRHSWNLVKLDGKYYHVDATWDDPTPNREGFVRHNYFLITDDEIKKNHAFNEVDYPKSAETRYPMN